VWLCASQGTDEPIPPPGYGLDVLRGFGGISQLAAKLIDEFFEGTIVSLCVWPCGGEKVLAFAELAGMRHEHFQDGEFFPAESFLLRSSPHTAIARVEIERLRCSTWNRRHDTSPYDQNRTRIRPNIHPFVMTVFIVQCIFIVNN
jgi:hypothetical protein